jgi:hypothetical protein
MEIEKRALRDTVVRFFTYARTHSEQGHTPLENKRKKKEFRPLRRNLICKKGKKNTHWENE